MKSRSNSKRGSSSSGSKRSNCSSGSKRSACNCTISNTFVVVVEVVVIKDVWSCCSSKSVSSSFSISSARRRNDGKGGSIRS